MQRIVLNTFDTSIFDYTRVTEDSRKKTLDQEIEHLRRENRCFRAPV